MIYIYIYTHNMQLTYKSIKEIYVYVCVYIYIYIRIQYSQSSDGCCRPTASTDFPKKPHGAVVRGSAWVEFGELG